MSQPQPQPRTAPGAAAPSLRPSGGPSTSRLADANDANRQLRVLLEQVAGGDERAGAELFDRYYVRVYRYALRRLRSPSDADDVAAETFARVVRDLGRFTWMGGGFEAWLFRMASNLIVDHSRRTNRERATGDGLPALQAEVETPEAFILRGETSTEIRGLLATLPAEQREVLLLRCAGQLGTNEISKLMGRKPNAVRQLQFRALSNLRKQLARPGPP